MDNREIENAAIAFVLDYERAANRTATDVRYSGAAGDVGSIGRMIEVKAYGRSARGLNLWPEARQYHEARRNSDFWIYVVANVPQGDPRQFGLVQLGGAQLAALLERAREQRTYLVSLPVSTYDEFRNEQRL